MTITESQRITIMQLWGRVCKDRKWQTSDKTFRLAKFSELLGRKLESTNGVERIKECTKLMNELKCLLGISIQAGKEAAGTASMTPDFANKCPARCRLAPCSGWAGRF